MVISSVSTIIAFYNYKNSCITINIVIYLSP